MRIQDVELCKAIEESAFHQGMIAAQQMQDNYRKAIKSRMMPRAIEVIHTIGAAVATGKYRQAITKAKKLIALMERISED